MEGMRNAMRNGQSDKMGLAEFQAKTDEEIKNKQFTHRPSSMEYAKVVGAEETQKRWYPQRCILSSD